MTATTLVANAIERRFKERWPHTPVAESLKNELAQDAIKAHRMSPEIAVLVNFVTKAPCFCRHGQPACQRCKSLTTFRGANG